MTEEVTSLKFVLPKTSALDPEEASRRAQNILLTVMDEKKVQEEVREVLADISLQKSKRKRKAAPNQDDSYKEEFTDEMVHALKEVLSESCQRSCSSGMESQLYSDPDSFKTMVESLANRKFNVNEFLNAVKHVSGLCDRIIENIITVIKMNWISFHDLVEVLNHEDFDKIGHFIIRQGDEACLDMLTTFLVNDPCQKSKLTSIIVRFVTDPPDVPAKANVDFKISANDLIPALLHQEQSCSMEDFYSRLMDVHKGEAFQNQVQSITNLISATPIEQILSVLTTTCSIFEVNHTLFSALWYFVIKKEKCITANFEFLSDFLRDALSKQHRHNFILSIILMRILDLVGSRSYNDSYQLYFGNGSTHITSSKSVEFIIEILTSLVPHEIGIYLKYHVQLPLRGGAKFKEKLEQYIMLAKTRMKDFNLLEIDKNVVHDVEKAISSFKKKTSIPSSVIEASIFKKQYYTNHFLPFLMKENSVEDEEGRISLLAALTAANKVPKSVTSNAAAEVLEISPSASLSDAIDSLPIRGADVKDTIYRMCASSCDEATLMLLIKTVCFECQHVDPVEFLKEFAFLHHLRDLFRNCVRKLICEDPRCDQIMPLLGLFDYDTNSMILKAKILKDKSFYKSISVELEMEFLHIIVLGKATDNPEFSPPDAVCQQLSIDKFCETINWWPYDRETIDEFQVTVSRILDRITSHQSCNELCMSLFKCALTLNILPFVSSCFLTLIPIVTFTKLWVYEALAQVLLPLYQGNSESKPVSKIQEIFRRFFKLVNVIKSSLLYRCGTFKSIDNLLSVLDSYKIYITTESYLLDYPIALTIVRYTHYIIFKFMSYLVGKV